MNAPRKSYRRLTKTEVAIIKADVLAGVNRVHIWRKFDIHPSTLSHIVTGRRHAEVVACR